MGAHQSTQTVNQTSNVVTTASMSSVQDCLVTSVGGQEIVIWGDDNVATDVDQNLTITVSAKCENNPDLGANYNNDVKFNLTSQLKDHEVDIWGWGDFGSDSQVDNMTQNITNTIKFEAMQKCVYDTAGTQVFVVKGDNNVVHGVLQKEALQVAGGCILNMKGAANVVNRQADTVNQSSDYSEEGPFAFISDMFKNMFSSGLMSILAVCFIVFMCFVLFVFMALTVGHKKKPAPAPIVVAR